MTRQTINTYLFVPASNRKFIDNIVIKRRWQPDFFIFDFEDAIRNLFDFDEECSLKICARTTLESYLPFPDDIRNKYLLRINSVDSVAFEADIKFLEDTKDCLPRAVILPKTEDAGDIKKLEEALPSPLAIIPLIESKDGVENADLILQASPRIRGLCFGHMDYFLERGGFPVPQVASESEKLQQVITTLINSARKWKKEYIDMGFYYHGRWEELTRHLRFLAYLSKGEIPLGKLVMHPDQIDHIRNIALEPPAKNPLEKKPAKKPSKSEIEEYAKKIVETYEERSDKTISVCRMEDAILTPQIYILAKNHLKKRD